MTSSSICRSVTYILWSSAFASYLEDYLMENVVLAIMDQCDTKIDLLKYMWVSHLYFIVHLGLPFIIVIVFNYLYTLRICAGWGIRAPPGTCYSSVCYKTEHPHPNTAVSVYYICKLPYGKLSLNICGSRT